MYDLALSHHIFPVPARFRDCSPKRWALDGAKRHPVAWPIARQWLARFPSYLTDSPRTEQIGRGLLLIGETGTGKTMLAASLINYLQARRGFSVAFVRDDTLNRLLATKYPSDEQADDLEVLRRVACLVVDDALRMGGEPILLEPFLRGRMDDGKPTIVTLNNNVSLSPIFASLMHEYARAGLDGEDMRRAAR